MAKAKSKGALAAEAAPELMEQARHMRQMMQDAGATGGSAAIFRKGGPGAGKDRFLEAVPVAEIWDAAHEYLAQRWGGGAYTIVLKNEVQQYVEGGRLTYDIEGAPIAKEAPETPEKRKLDELERQVAEALNKDGGKDAASSAELMRFMMEISREQLREVRNPPAAAYGANPAEMAVNMMTAIQTAQAPLLAALIDRASQPAPDTMAQLRGMVEMFTMMRELTNENRPESSGWDRIAATLADPLGKLVGQHVENQAAGLAPPSTMPQPRPTLPPPNGGPPVQRPPWLQFLAPYLPQLLAFAEAGRDPAITADFIAEGIPDEHLGALYEQLSRPTFNDELAHAVPETAPHRQWFQRFCNRVLEWVVPEGPDTPEGAPVVAMEADTSPPEVGTVARMPEDA